MFSCSNPHKEDYDRITKQRGYPQEKQRHRLSCRSNVRLVRGHCASPAPPRFYRYAGSLGAAVFYCTHLRKPASYQRSRSLFSVLAGMDACHCRTVIAGRFRHFLPPRIEQARPAALFHWLRRSPWLSQSRSDDIPLHGIWEQAHTTLEIAVEMGIPFTILLGVAWIAVFFVLGRGILIRKRDEILPLAAFWLGLLAIGHSQLDFPSKFLAFRWPFALWWEWGWRNPFQAGEKH